MAAVTIEDCLKIVQNRFELSLIANYRAKQLMNGAPALYKSEKKEKNTVIALREIAANLLDLDAIRAEIQENIKNKALFKNFDENTAFNDRKSFEDENDEDLSSNDELNDEIDNSNDDDSLDEEEDEEYYDDIDSEIDDDLEEDQK